MERETNVEVLDFDKSQNIEVLVQEEVQLDINVPLFYIKSGEEDIKAYVTNHAKPQLDDFTKQKQQEISQTAEETIKTVEDAAGTFVEEEIKPAISEYADSVVKPFKEAAGGSAAAAERAKKAAETAAAAAVTSAEQAQTALEQATGEINEAKTAAIEEFNTNATEKLTAFNTNAAEKQDAVDASAAAAAESADKAEQAAAKAEASTQGGFYNRVHDCILENPRYIIWEQNGNTLTLKAGTKLWYPDGRSVVLENDISGTMTSSADLVWVDLENNSLLFRSTEVSGPSIYNTISDFPNYLNEGDFGYIISETKFVMSQNGLPVGDYPVPLPVETIIDRTTYTKYLIIDESTFNKGMIVFRTQYGAVEYIFIPEGIKTLACSGLKTDGSYNNVKYTTPSVMTLDEDSSFYQPHYFAIKTDGTVQISDSGFKVTDDNYLQNLSTNEIFSGVRLGNYRDEYATNIYDTLDLQNSTRVFYWDD